MQLPNSHILFILGYPTAAGLGVGGTLGVVFASLAVIVLSIVLLLIAWRKYNKSNTEPNGMY